MMMAHLPSRVFHLLGYRWEAVPGPEQLATDGYDIYKHLHKQCASQTNTTDTRALLRLERTMNMLCH